MLAAMLHLDERRIARTSVGFFRKPYVGVSRA
jgi:hypothetical protein